MSTLMRPKRKPKHVAPNSPLQLRLWLLQKLVFRRNEAYSHSVEESEDYNVLVDFDVIKFEEGDFVIPFAVSMKPSTSDSNYKIAEIAVELDGYFSVASGADPWQFLPGNALAMLYGIARGLVQPALSNALGPFAALPIVNLEVAIAKRAKEKKRELERAGKASQENV